MPVRRVDPCGRPTDGDFQAAILRPAPPLFLLSRIDPFEAHIPFVRRYAAGTTD
jgi:hypothetical protein